MRRIKSKDNKRVKFARKVAAGRAKNHIFIEGTRLVKEVLNSDVCLTEAFVSESFVRSNQEFLRDVLIPNLKISRTTNRIFSYLAQTETPQGVALICEKPNGGKELIEQRLQAEPKDFSIVLMLHGISNPGNVGAILRIAEAVNIAGVIVTKNSADPFSAKALRGSMGASVRIPICQQADFEETIRWGTKLGLISTFADVKAKKSYLETDWKQPRLLVFGSEADGLTNTELKMMKEGIFIPMENRVESLNLAVACSVILFEAKRTCKSKK